jgi:NTP pyrophosphatase (non-canonical NTP hydrolase)
MSQQQQNKNDQPTILWQLAEQCAKDSERWFGDFDGYRSIPYHTLCMAGEVGEFANIVKKIERGSLDIRDPKVRYDLANELTDTFVYMLNIAGLLHIDLGKNYQYVRAANEKRFMAEREARAEQNGQ